MRILNTLKRREEACALRKLSRNRISVSMDVARWVGTARCAASRRLSGQRCVPTVFASLLLFFLCAIPSHAEEAPYASASISGLGARNIGSATMSGRVSAIAGTREPSGKITLFVGAASGGGWEIREGGARPPAPV